MLVAGKRKQKQREKADLEPSLRCTLEGPEVEEEADKEKMDNGSNNSSQSSGNSEDIITEFEEGAPVGIPHNDACLMGRFVR